MNTDIVKFNAVKNHIITLRNEKVIIDFDIAQM